MPNTGPHSFSVDAANRITSTNGSDSFVYDGDGTRVKNAYLHFFSGGRELSTVDGSTGDVITEYVYFAGQRVASYDDDGTVHFYFLDHLGSTRVVTNAPTASGASVTLEQDIDYKPFGATSTSVDGFTFTGYDRDGTLGLDYAGARYYKHTIGRFMSPDPAPGNVLNPQTWNRYAYVLNDPINLRDPSGLDVECVTSSINGQLTTGGCRWVDRGEGWAGTGDDLFSLYPILGIPNNTPVDEANLAWLNRDTYAELLRDYWAQQNSGTTPSAQSQPTPQSQPYDPPIEKDFFHNNASCPKCGNLWNSAASWGNALAGATPLVFLAPLATELGGFAPAVRQVFTELLQNPTAWKIAVDALSGATPGTPTPWTPAGAVGAVTGTKLTKNGLKSS